uniref:Dolichol phosphate-mannose biosynthesis regulatory protein n=1 Tax=Ditylenchus dipsaci TaxID=166011 RepID=A0A915EP72_9BILA
MVRSFNFEELAGYSILAITIPSISYLLLWIFGVPFIPDESILRAFFPSQIHGVIIPLSLFWIITIIGDVSLNENFKFLLQLIISSSPSTLLETAKTVGLNWPTSNSRIG